MRKIIKISGLGTTNFLQKITSNDLNNSNGNLIYSLLLTPQGKVLEDFFLLQEDDDAWLLDCNSEGADKLLSQLKKYSLGLQLSIELDNKRKVFLSQEGPGYKDPRDPRLGYRYYSEEAENLILPSPDLYYDLAIPILYSDFLPGEFYPFDLGFDYGLSYSKGCYIGQEVITRTKFLGEVRKKVCKIKLLQALTEKEDLYLEGRKIGQILALYPERKALALVKKDLVREGDFLTNQEGQIIAQLVI
jgi:folate-binding protein YgfZ